MRSPKKLPVIRKAALPCRRRQSESAVTLIELMVVVGLMVVLAYAVTIAFVAGVDAENVYARREQNANDMRLVEQKITTLLQSAILDENTADANTYFVGEYGNNGSSANVTANGAQGGSMTLPGSSTGAATSGSTGSSGSNTSSNGTDLGCDRIVFTTTAPGVPLATQNNSTDDFLTQHQANGPIGGTEEVSFSVTAVGDAGDRTGLFERIQKPSDGDATQGGTETLISDKIEAIGFQFWDGTQWDDSWDSTTTPDTNELPAAVMVSYTLVGDPTQQVYQFLVDIPTSQVTENNPITQTTTSGGGT